jgi:uracil-DNA glycosylase family 4
VVSLEKLKEEILKCKKCGIEKQTKNKTIGKGSKNPKVVFVGLNPGTEENECGIPFVGRSGKLLNKWIQYLGLDNDNCAVINIIKCYTPNATGLDGEEMNNCYPFYEKQIELLNPEIIVALGYDVYHKLTGKTDNITNVAGQMFGNIFVIPHPSFFVRKGGKGWEEYIDQLRHHITTKNRENLNDRLTNSPQSYVPLHVHTEYSITDGAGRLSSLVNEAVTNGFSTLAITDHGTVAGWYAFREETTEQYIKPIYGVEFYVTDDYEVKDRERHHLVLLAKNKEGMENILKLNKIAHVDGFYYKPRITLADVIKHKNGIVALSACTLGIISKRILDNEMDKAHEIINQMKEAFGDDFYIEYQVHNFEQQLIVNPILGSLADEYNIKTVITTDIHYRNPKMKELHNAVKAIGFRKKYGEASFDGDTHCMLSTKDLKEAGLKTNLTIEMIEESMKNTIEVAKKCNAQLDRFETVMPKFILKEVENDTIKENGK